MNEQFWQSGSTILGGAFVAVLSLAFIASRVMVSWKKAIAEVKVADADGEIYKKLNDRNSKLEEILGKVYEENKDLIIRVAKLEGLADDLKESRDLIQKLKEKLDSKDLQLEALIKSHADERTMFYQVLNRKDEELAKRDHQIARLTDAVHELEIRLMSDEKKLIQMDCPYNKLHTNELNETSSLLLGGGATGHQIELKLAEQMTKGD